MQALPARCCSDFWRKKRSRAVRRGAVHWYCDRFRRIPVQQHLSAHDAGCGRSDGKGVPFTRIIEDAFFKKTYVQNQIMGRTLTESIMLLDKQCIVGIVRKKVMDFYGLTTGDMDGIVSQLKIQKAFT